MGLRWWNPSNRFSRQATVPPLSFLRRLQAGGRAGDVERRGEMMLAVVVAMALALAGVAHLCRRWESRHRARLVAMRWDEISAQSRSRKPATRALLAGRRQLGRARDPLLLTAVCVTIG